MLNPSKRHDHTAWLTHFVRDRIPEQDFPGTNEEESGFFSGGELEYDSGAFEVLKAIIRLGGITPGYSFRGGRTTIYGGQPAVCATEMPLYSFATYARERADTGKVSAYGVSFLKSEFFKAGGRPAIYGLSTDKVTYAHNTPACRVFDEAVLPQSEQYRFVAHNPAGSTGRIDWSHEREWRWVARNEDLDEIWVKDHNDTYSPTPALPIFKGQLDGRPFTRVCIIVWTPEEADEIREILTGLFLAGSNNYGTPFDRALIKRSHIVVLQDVVDAVERDKDLDSQTIEGLAQASLLKPITISAPPADAAKVVADAMAAAGSAASAASAAFIAKLGAGSGLCGFAHAVTYDVTNSIVQYLLSTEQATGPYDGAVWIQYPGAHGSSDLDHAEAVCKAAATALSEKLGISVHVETRWD